MIEGPAETRKLETRILGQPTRFAYSERWVGYSLFGGRIIMGYVLLLAGLEKLLEPGWTAAGYLQNAVPEGNPFGGFFASLAGNVVVDQLVIWGLLLTGLALALGLFVRWSAFWAAVMMLLFWASSLEGGLLQGLPVENGFVVDSHLVYVVLLFALGAFGAGRVLGLDSVLERTRFVERHPGSRYALG